MTLLTLLPVPALAAVALVQARFSRKFSAEAGRLFRAVSAGPAGTGSARPPAGHGRPLPGRSGAEGTARAVRLTMATEMELKPGQGFRALPAVQVSGVGAPQFAWLAEAPGWPVPKFRVIDSFVAGQGVLRVRLAGSVPVTDFTGPDVDLGEAMRYLAELPWVPDAILGNPAIRWRGEGDWTVAALDVDGRRAEVALRLEDGDIVEMRAEGRPAMGEDGKTELRRWEGHYANYAEIGGRRLPLSGNVGYVTDGKYTPYWRGRLTAYDILR